MQSTISEVNMETDIMKLVEGAARELEQILSSKTVVGAPLEIHGRTIIPLISVGFGIGVGGGKGTDRKNGEGGGSAVGFGGGVKPVAVVISDASGIRVETIKGSAATAAEHIAETIGKVMSAKESPATD
ncbi:MAG TPA: spore germination protein GerW family protein [Polyangiaceae bacterium]